MKKTIIAIGGGSFGQLKIYPDGRQVQKPMETLKIDKKNNRAYRKKTTYNGIYWCSAR